MLRRGLVCLLVMSIITSFIITSAILAKVTKEETGIFGKYTIVKSSIKNIADLISISYQRNNENMEELINILGPSMNIIIFETGEQIVFNDSVGIRIDSSKEKEFALYSKGPEFGVATFIVDQRENMWIANANKIELYYHKQLFELPKEMLDEWKQVANYEY